MLSYVHSRLIVAPTGAKKTGPVNRTMYKLIQINSQTTQGPDTHHCADFRKKILSGYISPNNCVLFGTISRGSDVTGHA
jgi:hypothetical protein